MEILQAEEVAAETQALQQQAAQDLAQWEQVIQDRLQAFFELGYALQVIREQGLYRLQFTTFEEYCAERWDFSSRRAEQLISSSLVRENLKQLMGNRQTEGHAGMLPQNESQARVVAQYSADPAQQLEFWQRALQTAPKGRVTAAHLKRVAAELRGDETQTTDAPTTRGGSLAETYCLFCRRFGRPIFPLGNSRQGICDECSENANAFHIQVKKENRS